MRRPLSLGIALVLHGGWLLRVEASSGGLGGTNASDVCSQTTEELQSLLINQEQEQNGVEGNTLVVNDCKALVEANVLNYRSDAAQKALCSNACYAKINNKYKTLLDNDCFADSDSDEEASAKLQAAAYQIACQTTTADKYCIPMLGDLVKSAGTTYNLCSDIVKDMGCCFQSYRQYMLLGTSASVAAMDAAQKDCTDSGVSGLDQMCPCAYNQYAFANTTFCSHATRARPSVMSAARMLALAFTTLAAVALV